MAQGGFLHSRAAGLSGCRADVLEADCAYQLDPGHRARVDARPDGATIRRLSLKRRPRAGGSDAEKTQAGISSSHWHSAESLSSSSSDDARLLGMSSTTRGRPPRPPPHGSSSEKPPPRTDGPVGSQALADLKAPPTTRSLALQRQSPMLEKTLLETQQLLEHEVIGHPPPLPNPRRRLASFGGVSSPGSPSRFTGLGAYNQNNNGNKPSGAGGDVTVHLRASIGSRGSTGCLKLSPQASGRTTPAASLGSMHLQHVRDQMVVALQRLKELEEQVKIIPILQVKISVLQEEKRQLCSQFKNQSELKDVGDAIWKRAVSMEESDTENKVSTEAKKPSGCTDSRKFRQLTEEKQVLERTTKEGELVAWREKTPHDMAGKAVEMTAAKEHKHVHTEQVETRSSATQVSEVSLGICKEREAEIEAQQLMISALKERICHLEAELKESALQTELSRLKLELQAAGARNRADKATIVRPSTTSTSTEARPHTTSQGVGHHIELRDASTWDVKEVKTVGVSCWRPELKTVGTGPDLPMSHWEVRERVDTREKCVGVEVSTNSQAVGVEVKLRDAESNTEAPVENLESKDRRCRSVACGDCSVDAIVCEAKAAVSRGVATELVKGVDLGVTAAPQTASQRTNTSWSSVSRFTNTRHTFSSDSSTNTVQRTQDKHTNTTQALTRTVSVGDRVKDVKHAQETQTIAVGTANLEGISIKQIHGSVNKMTRDAGVGFININDNFLVGLKTRNMASGPSHLPDPIKTRSVGVGEGRIRDLSALSSPHNPPIQGLQHQAQSQWDPDLNHYIEKMQWLLREQGGLLTEASSEQTQAPVQQRSSRGRASAAPHRSERAAAGAAADARLFNAQPPAKRDLQPPPKLPADCSECDGADAGFCQQGGKDSEVKRMIQMLEQQTCSALQDRPTHSDVLRKVTEKQNGDQGCSSTRRSLKFLQATTGLDPMSPPKLSANERKNPEGVERRGNRKLREASQDAVQAREVKGGSSRGCKGSTKPHSRHRWKLSDKMFSACQALKMHLSGHAALPGRELHDSLQALQQEWFLVSSQRSAAPDAVDDHVAAFRLISPAVLRHIANMADGNGNTALHYSVSHSNFAVVKKLLDAEVCNVNQQNKAGYTPIMLAALSAVERPEDMRVVEQLFTKGDVNAKASQAGQTALMLAVSHGRTDMVQALLAQGAQVNLQDDEGSTALMCASEHGHAAMVKLLLAQADCDASLTDSDESTALSIALDAGHSDIAVLLYAHANFSKGQAGAAAHYGGRSSACAGRSVFE